MEAVEAVRLLENKEKWKYFSTNRDCVGPSRKLMNILPHA